jgi:Zn-dependent M16 (insulinase) family peptidase
MAVNMSSQQHIPTFSQQLNGFLQRTQLGSLAADESTRFTPSANWQSPTAGGPVRTWIPMPFATNFAAQSIRTVPYDHPDGASLQILGALMSTHFIHREVREKNGAYGGSASYSPLDGLFNYSSYRDPNPLKSLQTFRRAAEWAAQQRFTDEQMTEAKLSVFRQVDAPVSVAAEGMPLFKHRLDDDLRQRRRERLLAVQATDLKAVAEKYLLADGIQTSYAVLASEDGTKQPQTRDEWELMASTSA